jgi:hypothetical protein
VLYEPGWLEGRLAKGDTLGAVAAEAGCSITAVRTAARKLAIADRRGHGEVRYPELHSRRWVRTQYVTDGRSVADIAAELGASPTSVYRAISAFGLAPAARRRSRPSPTRLRAGWRRVGTVRGMARLLGVSQGSAEVWLAEVGIFTRDVPAIPPDVLRRAIGAGESVRTIARRHMLDPRVVRVELRRLAHDATTERDSEPRCAP